MKKILVVDDDKDIVEVIEAILKLENYHVIHSYTGKDSIPLAKKEKPDLILLDYMLPDITGKDVVEHLRKIPVLKDTPIFLISAAHGLDGLTTELSIQGLLKKPFELESLLSLVSSILHKPKNTSS